MKRIFNLLAIVLVATLVLSACGTPAATKAPAGSAPVTSAPATVLPVVSAPTFTSGPAPAAAGGPQLVVYMQMGGTQGDASTLARTNGAEAAAKALNIKLIEQYSGWDPNKMIDQFKQAMAANPDGIVIMDTRAKPPLAHWWTRLRPRASSLPAATTRSQTSKRNIRARVRICRRQPARRRFPDRPGDDRGWTEIRR